MFYLPIVWSSNVPTRVSSWNDGVYLSNDSSLDPTDYPLVEGSLYSNPGRVQPVSLVDANGKPRFLQPGESYTMSATFHLPQSISGNYNIIVKTDTATIKDWYYSEPSSIRDGLDVVTGNGAGAVLEFQNEGNNVSSIAPPITLATPPDLQVSVVNAPASGVGGQSFSVDYHVTNAGGDTPSDQGEWKDVF